MKKPIVPKRYQKFYIETARQKVFEILFKFPEIEFSLSDLAKLAKVAKANIGDILAELEKADFIEITRLSNIWRIKANQNNWHFVKSKIAHNLNFVYQSGLVELLVEIFNNPKSITLFGSFRNGEDISNSDIDIAIESDDFKDYEVVGMVDLIEFEKAIGRKIQIHKFNRKNIDDNLFNTIANGILLSGFLEVKP